MFVISAVVFQDIGDATSVSLLNLDPSEHTPEVICENQLSLSVSDGDMAILSKRCRFGVLSPS